MRFIDFTLSTIGLSCALVLSSAPARGDEPISSMRVDSELSRDLGGKCRYSASIHGTILPVNEPAAKAKGPPVVDPKVDVMATVTCPNAEAVKVTDNVMGTGPLTRDQLARALERRATVVVPRSSGRCVYVPEMSVTGTQVELRAVSSDCR